MNPEPLSPFIQGLVALDKAISAARSTPPLNSQVCAKPTAPAAHLGVRGTLVKVDADGTATVRMRKERYRSSGFGGGYVDTGETYPVKIPVTELELASEALARAQAAYAAKEKP